MLDLHGKVCVVTGAAGGLGLAMAQQFVTDGATVVIADIDESNLATAAQLLRSTGAEVLAVATDVSVHSDVQRLAEAAVARYGAVHVVCNNAGVVMQGRTWELHDHDWQWIFGVNLGGVVNGIRVFVPLMLEQNEGHVLNTASNTAVLTLGGNAAYVASKHAVLSVSESLQQDLRAIGSSVRVSVIIPGPIRSNMAESFRHRPPRFGEGTTRPPHEVAANRARLEERGEDPQVLADRIATAMQEDRFYIFTHPHTDPEKARIRFEGIMSGTLPPPIPAS
jgi:NAD(P)-dependent dehydrogenase (short-subunit alcohol dehydrogenase family)